MILIFFSLVLPTFAYYKLGAKERARIFWIHIWSSSFGQQPENSPSFFEIFCLLSSSDCLSKVNKERVIITGCIGQQLEHQQLLLGDYGHKENDHRFE